MKNTLKNKRRRVIMEIHDIVFNYPPKDAIRTLISIKKLILLGLRKLENEKQIS